jgi:hypothetical protein
MRIEIATRTAALILCYSERARVKIINSAVVEPHYIGSDPVRNTHVYMRTISFFERRKRWYAVEN